jgi:hypothetical protein
MKIIFLKKATQAYLHEIITCSVGAQAQNVDFEENCSTGINYFIVVRYKTNSVLPNNIWYRFHGNILKYNQHLKICVLFLYIYFDLG